MDARLLPCSRLSWELPYFPLELPSMGLGESQRQQTPLTGIAMAEASVLFAMLVRRTVRAFYGDDEVLLMDALVAKDDFWYGYLLLPRYSPRLSQVVYLA